MQPGWHPDPTGRYDVRYFNGEGWTADVATAGERHVDALGVAPSPVGAPGTALRPPYIEATNGLATAAMVTGCTGLALGVILLFPLSFPLGVLAIVFGAIGLRRSRKVGRGRPQAITGLVLGPLTLGVSIFAVVTLWSDLVEAVRDASVAIDAEAYDVELEPAEIRGREVRCAGTVTNERSRSRAFLIRIDFLPRGSSTPFATERTPIIDVDGFASSDFSVTSTLEPGVEFVRCSLNDIRETD